MLRSCSSSRWSIGQPADSSPPRVPSRLSFALLLAAAIVPADEVTASIRPNFESPTVHPLELTQDGGTLLALNVADYRLAIFDLTDPVSPQLVEEIQVGIEPVSVRARTASEVWVVNHLSDSISIIDLSIGSVVRTVLVGDEPTDVVFAGTPARAFVCLSRENRIRVLDPENLDAPPEVIPLLASRPLALAASRDGSAVQVAVLDSGNRTTVISEGVVSAGGGLPPPDPPLDPDLPEPPLTALILRHDGTAWRDNIDRDWSAFVPYTLYDHDVIEISTATREVTRAFPGVGTDLFSIAVHPDGRLFVGNMEAFNEIRLEPNLRGRFRQNRVTVIDPVTESVLPVHLNQHIDYGIPEGSAGERALSLAFPLDIAISSDGSAAYVAAFGSAAVGVLDANANVVEKIPVGAGPSGIALRESSNHLYVLNRIGNSITSVDLSTRATAEVRLGFDPVPPEERRGQLLFNDAKGTSAHGDLSCASCHLFGGMDNLAWDIGDPHGEYIESPGGAFFGIHPMKGPMTTQTLEGLDGLEPFHWRGDRATLEEFNPAFVSLMGRAEPLAPIDFADLESFIFSLSLSPNPNRNLDGSLPDPPTGPSPARGENLFRFANLFDGASCSGCHVLPLGTNRAILPGAVDEKEQNMKVPHLRNLHEKTGFDEEAEQTVRGFGFSNDGVLDDLVTFLRQPRFTFDNDQQRFDIEAFLLAFDTGTHAAVGAQWTMDGSNEAEGSDRLETLESLAAAGTIGLIAKGRDLASQARGYVRASGGDWTSDRVLEPPLELTDLLALAGPGTEVTFTAVAAGTEFQLGVDRDADGFRDRDELDAGSDPADPGSTPPTIGVHDMGATVVPVMTAPVPNPATERTSFLYALTRDADVALTVHDVQGARVRGLARGEVPAGEHRAAWDLRGDDGALVPAGVYFLRLQVGVHIATQRVVVQAARNRP